MTRKLIPALILLALASGIGAAHAIGLGQLGARFGGLGSIGKKKAAGPQATGKILLADGVSFLLLTDGASKLCRAGGC